MHYYYFGLESSLIRNIEMNYPNFNESIINWSLNIDVVTLIHGTKNISKHLNKNFLELPKMS